MDTLEKVVEYVRKLEARIHRLEEDNAELRRLVAKSTVHNASSATLSQPNAAKGDETKRRSASGTVSSSTATVNVKKIRSEFEEMHERFNEQIHAKQKNVVNENNAVPETAAATQCSPSTDAVDSDYFEQKDKNESKKRSSRKRESRKREKVSEKRESKRRESDNATAAAANAPIERENPSNGSGEAESLANDSTPDVPQISIEDDFGFDSFIGGALEELDRIESEYGHEQKEESEQADTREEERRKSDVVDEKGEQSEEVEEEGDDAEAIAKQAEEDIGALDALIDDTVDTQEVESSNAEENSVLNEDSEKEESEKEESGKEESEKEESGKEEGEKEESENEKATNSAGDDANVSKESKSDDSGKCVSPRRVRSDVAGLWVIEQEKQETYKKYKEGGNSRLESKHKLSIASTPLVAPPPPAPPVVDTSASTASADSMDEKTAVKEPNDTFDTVKEEKEDAEVTKEKSESESGEEAMETKVEATAARENAKATNDTTTASTDNATDATLEKSSASERVKTDSGADDDANTLTAEEIAAAERASFYDLDELDLDISEALSQPKRASSYGGRFALPGKRKKRNKELEQKEKEERASLAKTLSQSEPDRMAPKRASAMGAKPARKSSGGSKAKKKKVRPPLPPKDGVSI